jgi:hypothetical protein
VFDPVPQKEKMGWTLVLFLATLKERRNPLDF